MNYTRAAACFFLLFSQASFAEVYTIHLSPNDYRSGIGVYSGCALRLKNRQTIEDLNSALEGSSCPQGQDIIPLGCNNADEDIAAIADELSDRFYIEKKQPSSQQHPIEAQISEDRKHGGLCMIVNAYFD